jgi:hypothetical protein
MRVCTGTPTRRATTWNSPGVHPEAALSSADRNNAADTPLKGHWGEDFAKARGGCLHGAGRPDPDAHALAVGAEHVDILDHAPSALQPFALLLGVWGEPWVPVLDATEPHPARRQGTDRGGDAVTGDARPFVGLCHGC